MIDVVGPRPYGIDEPGNSPKAPGSTGAPRSAPDGTMTGTHVVLSERALLAQRVFDSARAADGVDTARVARVKQAIKDGTYTLSPVAIAQGLIEAAQGGRA